MCECVLEWSRHVKRKNNTLDSGFVLSHVNPFKEGESLFTTNQQKNELYLKITSVEGYLEVAVCCSVMQVVSKSLRLVRGVLQRIAVCCRLA